jgi:isocitrate/isopropylmalate dehydrogenase
MAVSTTSSVKTRRTDLMGSAARYKSTGSYVPQGFPDELRRFDAILFGAVGDPDVSVTQHQAHISTF